MNESLRDDRVQKVTQACRVYWRRNGVPEARTAEMSAEIRDHLGEALADGKSVEDVVGRDVAAFAEEWAAPNRPARSLGEETLDVVSDTTFALAVVGVLAHLALWSSSLLFNAEYAIGALLLALLLARLFAYLRAPSDAPPDAEESVLDRYPRRLHDRFLWLLVAVWAVHLFLPLPETVLFRWPVQATLVLPLVAVLVREAKRLLARNALAGPPLDIEKPEKPLEQQLNAVVDCSFYWSKMRIPEDQIYDLSRDLDEHIEQAREEGRSVRSVVGDDVEAFAEAWAEEHGAEPDASSGPRSEPLKDVISGWVLSFSACATVLATFAHLQEWSLYVPVVWVFGVYLFLVAAWFGQPVADLFDRMKTWRYSPAKSMLAAGMLVLLIAAVAGAVALLFMVVGPRIPFEWPWYATAVCALVACSIVASWLWRFSREEAERERRRTEGV